MGIWSRKSVATLTEEAYLAPADSALSARSES